MTRVMIVTGGSRGIGAATARLAGRRGYHVCLGYNANEARARAVVDDILRAGARAVAVKADMAHEDDIRRLFETCAGNWALWMCW